MIGLRFGILLACATLAVAGGCPAGNEYDYVIIGSDPGGGSLAYYTVIMPNPKIDMKQALRDEVFGHHPTSSCRIGPDSKESCVDSKFRVHGVDNLRVVDASVFPRPPGAMPNVPTFTISRKAFEDILESLS